MGPSTADGGTVLLLPCHFSELRRPRLLFSERQSEESIPRCPPPPLPLLSWISMVLRWPSPGGVHGADAGYNLRQDRGRERAGPGAAGPAGGARGGEVGRQGRLGAGDKTTITTITTSTTTPGLSYPRTFLERADEIVE